MTSTLMNTLAALALVSSLAGCRARNLAYVYDLKVGIDVAAAAEPANGRFVFGYDRTTFALVPQREDEPGPCPQPCSNPAAADGADAAQTASVASTNEAPAEPDAGCAVPGDTPSPAPSTSTPTTSAPRAAGELMTLTAVSRVRADNLNVDFDHFVATGAAAVRVAQDPSGLSMIRQAIFHEEGQK